MTSRFTFWRGLGLMVLAAGLLGMVSCIPVPLGDPAKSKVDARLNGAWEWRDGNNIEVAIFQPWDEKTYIVDVLTAAPADGGNVKPVQRDVFKGWLTMVKGQQFLTLAPLESVGALPGAAPAKYIVAKIKIEGDTLTAVGIDPQYPRLKEVSTPTALENVIFANFDDPKLFLKPLLTTKWDADQIGRLEKIRAAFHNWPKP